MTAGRASLEHFQAKPALGLDPGVDTGSPSENATTQRETERSPILSRRDSLYCSGTIERITLPPGPGLHGIDAHSPLTSPCKGEVKGAKLAGRGSAARDAHPDPPPFRGREEETRSFTWRQALETLH
jgi:hypothetical protein